MTRRVGTTKDIGLLKQLHDQGQLVLAAEFQRNSVWPRSAKAYLIDTIINDRPIPLLFFQRISSAQTGRPAYSIIDGQQRLRAIFEFLDDRFRLTLSNKKAAYYNKKFSELPQALRESVQSYDLAIQELTGYDDADIKDIFVRMNKYVVKLSPQELRHARGEGKFSEFVERLGKWDFWRDQKVISAQQIRRMRAVEFVAELTILLIEGPQDKKSALDLYYGKYKKTFSKGSWVEGLLKHYLAWILKALPDLKELRYHSPTDLYSLIGALHELSSDGDRIDRLGAAAAGESLRKFADATKAKNPSGGAARYVAAASRQTDNIQPRTTRIEILSSLIQSK